VSVNGTAAYDRVDGLPEMVAAAVTLALQLNFPYSCQPEQGRLLSVLAGAPRGGLIGETGTGCGVGLAWLWSGADATTRLVSVERDAAHAQAAAELFQTKSNVTVLHADWTALLDHGPFDLLVLDGGGSGKSAGDSPVDPRRALKSFGTVVIDDFTPLTTWPPTHGGDPDTSRLHWLTHPNLLATEIMLSPSSSTILGMALPAAATP
jgi:predicted O-methyltransferase YrrM